MHVGPGGKMSLVHRWHPINDLAEHDRLLGSSQLDTLRGAWRNRRAQLQGTPALDQFVARMVRQWSIQTGLLERLYTIDAGVTLTLVEQGFDAAYIPHGTTDVSAEYLIRVLNDHRAAAEGLFAFVKSERPLSTSYIKELHAALCRSQETSQAIDSLGRSVQVKLLRGAYKNQPNNPRDLSTGEVVFEYCPPEHVESEMDTLVAMHLAHRDVPSEVEAAWLHHRFVQIHPFQDGNGRVARALATLVCLRDGGFPLVVMNDEKAEYIEALRAADRGDLRPFVELVGRLQTVAYQQSLSLSRDVIEEVVGVDAILAEARRRIETQRRDRLPVHAGAQRLHEIARKELQDVEKKITTTMAGLGAAPKVTVDASDPLNPPSLTVGFGSRVTAVAHHLGYRPDLAAESWWTQLSISSPAGDLVIATFLIVSLHHLGERDAGLMAASAFTFKFGPGAGPEPTPLCDVPFFWSDTTVDEAAFRAWLASALRRGIASWSQTL